MKKILIYHPDIKTHRSSSLYTNIIYEMCEEKFIVQSLEWYILNFYKRNIAWLYLNWYENSIGGNAYLIQKLQYSLKLLLLKIAKKRGHKIAIVVHNKAPHNMTFETKIFKSAYVPFMRAALQLSDKIVVVSRHTSEFISHTFDLPEDVLREKISYVPIGIGERLPCNTKEIRHMYGLDESELVLCYAGKMNPYKNIDLIIDAFIESEIQGKLLLIGKASDDYDLLLKEKIQNNNNILFINKVLSEEEMSCVIQSVNVLVLPYENTSLNSGTIIYAFSNSTTVICTNIEMLQDYPSNLYYGYSHSNREENLNGLKEKMKLVEIDYRNESLTEKGRQLCDIVKKENNWNRVKECLHKTLS